MTINQVLKKYWGYDAFRPLQQEIIEAVLNRKDVLALLPTGGGKSICFQVPALASGGLCLVVSPLIALMKDQVLNLKKKGIPALVVYSGMSFLETKTTLQNAAHGNYKFLYVSPERLETKLFLEYLPAINISLIAVDEAHCISQWGYDFRPPYLRIAALREHLPGVPVLALTASATRNVQDDIAERLAFAGDALRFQQSFDRPNLSYSAFDTTIKQPKILEILKKVPGTAIVYCKTRKHCKELAEILRLNGINADFYHAGLPGDERNKRQEDWINNRIRVIVCTNAFGMGIDKPDVRLVIHYGVPDCLENYYQEAGRAGRDGRRAYAVLLYNQRELDELKKETSTRFPPKETIQKIYTDIMNFLQVPAGGGENNSYDFDLANFCKLFKNDTIGTAYAIKVLEQEGLFVFSDSFYKPSTLVFTCTREMLNDLEEKHPLLSELSKALLRSYEGIFDFPASINENHLAKFTRQTREQVQQQLQQAAALGIVQYQPQKDTPQIILLRNRMYTDSFQINLQDYYQRKKLFETRVAAMVDFAQNSGICRSELVAAYFGGTVEKRCGICDNCINLRELTISNEEFNSISSHILQAMPVAIQDLMQTLTRMQKSKYWKVLDYLQSEKKILLNKEGKLVNNI